MSCYCPHAGFHQSYAERTAHNLPWPERTTENHLEEIETVLLPVYLDGPLRRQQLCGMLKYVHAYPFGRSVHGVEGRAFALRANDRLVIGGTLRTIGELDTIETPCTMFCSPDASGLRH